jgi:hypothetical protein
MYNSRTCSWHDDDAPHAHNGRVAADDVSAEGHTQVVEKTGPLNYVMSGGWQGGAGVRVGGHAHLPGRKRIGEGHWL